MQTRRALRLIRRGSTAAWLLLTSAALLAQGTAPSTLTPASTPAHQIFDLSIFVVVRIRLQARFRRLPAPREPPARFGSTDRKSVV